MRGTARWTVAAAGLSLAYLLAYPLAIGRADESHLLYGARRLLDGEVIYRDFYETLTPLGFYLFAAVFRVAGTTLHAARVTMAVIEAAGAALLFHLVRRAAGTGLAALAGMVFVGLCIPVWPIASLHWITTTLGLAVATVTLSGRWRESSRLRPLVAGLLAGVAVCVQQQRAVFIAAWLPVALALPALELLPGRRGRTLRRELGWAVTGGALVVLVVLGAATRATSPAVVYDQLVGFALKHYAPTHSGQAWAAVLPLTDVNLRSTWYWLLRGAPLVLIPEALLLLRRVSSPWRREYLERACLWGLGVMMAASVIYFADFIHVSFVLPFLLLPLAGTLGGLRAGRGAAVVAVGTWIGIAAVGAKSAANVRLAHTLAPARFETAFGTVQGAPALRDLYEAARRHLPRTPGRRPLLYSYPDDAWLYLALDARNPTRFDLLVVKFFPDDLVDEVVAALRAQRPDTVVIFAAGTPPPIRPAVEEGYQPVEDVGWYRVYVRRGGQGAPGEPTSSRGAATAAARQLAAVAAFR